MDKKSSRYPIKMASLQMGRSDVGWFGPHNQKRELDQEALRIMQSNSIDTSDFLMLQRENKSLTKLSMREIQEQGRDDQVTSREDSYEEIINNNQMTTKTLNQENQLQQTNKNININNNITNQQHNHNHHAGPVMGMLFRVWSRVKRNSSGSSSSASSSRAKGGIKRQNSEDAGQFCYISGEQLDEASRASMTMLEDDHFRRAGSQPPSQQQQQQLLHLTNNNHLLALKPSTEPLNGTGSSGISTASNSSNLQAQLSSSSSPSPPIRSFTPSVSVKTNSSIQRQRLQRSKAKEIEETNQIGLREKIEPTNSLIDGNNNFNNKVRRSVSSMGQPNSCSFSFNSSNLIGQNRTSRGTRFSVCSDNLDNQDQSFCELSIGERDGISEASDSGADIYSTPHESFQSVQSGLRIVKSFSTNNFNNPIQLQSNQHSNRSLIKPIDETNENVKDIIEQPNKSIKNTRSKIQLQDSKMFISSSSSDDTTTTTTVSNQSTILNPIHHHQQQQTVTQRIPVQFGLHSHAISPPSTILRPSSLLMQSNQSPNTMLSISPHGMQLVCAASGQSTTVFIPSNPTNKTAAMSPSEPQPAPLSSFVANQNNSNGLKGHHRTGYKKSPSLFEFSKIIRDNKLIKQELHNRNDNEQGDVKKSLQQNKDKFNIDETNRNIPNSISLYDYRSKDNSSRCLFTHSKDSNEDGSLIKRGRNLDISEEESEYKLTQMMLDFGSNVNAKDDNGFTALMHACLSGNQTAIRCLIEHGSDVNQRNDFGQTALDLICDRKPSDTRLEILRFLIENKGRLDDCSEFDGTRLLDRLIEGHNTNHGGGNINKLPYIECLLQNGAKIGSSTWLAARDKQEVQIKLLRKLCQDGYYLYKKSSIEAAIYRFEYALRRLSDLEQQLVSIQHQVLYQLDLHAACRAIKYQAFLGLSRCERKRKSYKKALEFAHSAILVDSCAYEAYYSKAHILKDIGDFENAFATIDQSSRLVDRSIEQARERRKSLELKEETMVFGGCFNMRDTHTDTQLIESYIQELNNTIEYLKEAKNFINRLRQETVEASQVEAN